MAVRGKFRNLWEESVVGYNIYINNKESQHMLSRNNTFTRGSFSCLRLYHKNRLLKERIMEQVAASQKLLAYCSMSVVSAISESVGEGDLAEVQPRLLSAKDYFKIIREVPPLNRTSQNAQPLANFPLFARHYAAFLQLLTLLLKEILILKINRKIHPWQSLREMHSPSATRLAEVVLPLLDVGRLKSDLLQETRREIDRLYKDFAAQFKFDRPLLAFLLVRLNAFGIVLARLVRQMRLLEELCKFPLFDPEDEKEAVWIARIEQAFAKKQLANLIRIYVEEQRRSLIEICYSCESRIPSSEMCKHMKACKAFFEIRKTIQKIDAEISGKHDDLKTMAMEAKRLQMERKKDMEKSKLKGTGKERGYFKEHAKSNVEQRTFHEYSGRGSSSSDSSNSLDRFNPPKTLKSLEECNTQDLKTYQWVADQLRLVSSKILAHRESVNLNIYNELKNIRATVKPRFENIGVNKKEIARIFELFLERMTAMQKLRKVQKEGNLSLSHLDTIDFEAVQKRKKRWYGKVDEGYFSGEEASLKNFQTSNNNVQLNSFRKMGLIGKGKYGQVYLVKKKTTGMKYAMKKVSIQNAKNYSEVDIFQVINSPFLVKAAFSFTEGNFHYFVMEYMPHGNFAQMVEQRLFQHEAKQYLAETVMAIDHLHQHGIIHRDIKPENIVIDAKGHLKLTDYGLSEAGLIKQKQKEEQEKSMSKFVLQEIKGKQIRSTKEACEKIAGSPYYMAPEVLTGNKTTKMSDWWSFGVLVYLALTGEVPFKAHVEKNLDEITKKVLERNIWPSDMKFGKGNNCISYEAKNLIEGLLCLDPSKRLGNDVEDIKNHNFFDGINWDTLLELTPYFAPDDDGETTVDEDKIEDSEIQDRFSSKSSNMSIRRDLLNSETQTRYEKSEAPYRRLMSYASKLDEL